MHMSQEQLLQYLQAHHISYMLYTHPPLFTSEQASAITQQLRIPGMGVKNLFLKDSKKRLYLISAAYTTAIDLKTTGKTLNAKELRFADASLLMKHLGVQPGSVTPLAILNDREHMVQLIIDTALFTHPAIQVHPLHNDATLVIAPDDLNTFFITNKRPYRMYDFKRHQIVHPV